MQKIYDISPPFMIESLTKQFFFRGMALNISKIIKIIKMIIKWSVLHFKLYYMKNYKLFEIVALEREIWN